MKSENNENRNSSGQSPAAMWGTKKQSTNTKQKNYNYKYKSKSGYNRQNSKSTGKPAVKAAVKPEAKAVVKPSPKSAESWQKAGRKAIQAAPQESCKGCGEKRQKVRLYR